MNVKAVGESADGESARFFSQMARRYESHVLAGISGVDVSGGGANDAVWYSPDGVETGRYRKVHLFPLAGEGNHYVGGAGSVVFAMGSWKVAPAICYDLRFPELFRQAVRDGAELFLVIANWPAIRSEHWVTLLRARAIENQAFVVGVNRCGSDPNHDYAGGSLVVSPTGEVLERAGDQPAVLRAQLDQSAVQDWRRRFPALSDMRLI